MEKRSNQSKSLEGWVDRCRLQQSHSKKPQQAKQAAACTQKENKDEFAELHTVLWTFLQELGCLHDI